MGKNLVRSTVFKQGCLLCLCVSWFVSQAMAERWGQSPQSLGDDHNAWELEAHYISMALVSYICTLSPQRIIIGGGVMKQERLLPLVRDKVRRMLNHYIQSGEVTDSIQDYIVAPKRGENAGVLGAFELAKLDLGIPH